MRASLAWYMATSARWSSSSAVVPWSGQSAAPMLASITTSSPSISNGAWSAAPMRRPMSAACASPAPGSSSANSSPPRRATSPRLADRVTQPGAELDEQQVAGVVAERVVEVLEAVEVDHRHGEPAVFA